MSRENGSYGRTEVPTVSALNRHIKVAAQQRQQVLKQKRLSAKHRIGLHKGPDNYLVTCNLCNPKRTTPAPLTNPNAEPTKNVTKRVFSFSPTEGAGNNGE